MNVVETLRSINTFDLLVVLFLFGLFILGFIQGTIRRLLGIGSILFSLLLSAQIREPLGSFLASNWTHLPQPYSYMMAMGTVFVAASIAFSLVIQGVYKRSPLFEKATIVDEVLGGLLGLLQGAIILGAIIIIMDPFYRIPGIAVDADEMKILRDFWNFMDGSVTAAIYRDQIVPAFFSIVGGIFPPDVRIYFPGPSESA